MNENTISLGAFKIRTDKVFVIGKNQDPSRLTNRLEKLVGEFKQISSWESFPEKNGHFILKVSGIQDQNAYVSFYEELGQALGSEFEVLPVLVDENGSSRYATGSLVVRFAEAKSDEDIETWSKNQSMEVKERNRYVPKQVRFQPLQSKRTLLSILAEINCESTDDESTDNETTVSESKSDRSKDSDSIEKIWPETLSRYDRGV